MRLAKSIFLSFLRQYLHMKCSVRFVTHILAQMDRRCLISENDSNPPCGSTVTFEVFNPPSSWIFTAVLVATLQKKRTFLSHFYSFQVTDRRRCSTATDPVPSECPHRQTGPPRPCFFTQLNRKRASLVKPASLGSPVESPKPLLSEIKLSESGGQDIDTAPCHLIQT